MNKYVNEFKSLECSQKIHDIVHRINRFDKEISESMAIIRYLRKITLKEPNKYCIVDLCAGNALTSIIASFLLPVHNAIAIDINKKQRSYNLVNKFSYLKKDIFEIPDYIPEMPCIIISSHPCQALAERIIDIYKNYDNCHYLILLPCCVAKDNLRMPNFIRQKLGSYLCWSYYLSIKANGNLYEDKNVISPCNVIVKANKIKDQRI